MKKLFSIVLATALLLCLIPHAEASADTVSHTHDYNYINGQLKCKSCDTPHPNADALKNAVISIMAI